MNKERRKRIAKIQNALTFLVHNRAILVTAREELCDIASQEFNAARATTLEARALNEAERNVRDLLHASDQLAKNLHLAVEVPAKKQKETVSRD